MCTAPRAQIVAARSADRALLRSRVSEGNLSANALARRLESFAFALGRSYRSIVADAYACPGLPSADTRAIALQADWGSSASRKRRAFVCAFSYSA